MNKYFEMWVAALRSSVAGSGREQVMLCDVEHAIRVVEEQVTIDRQEANELDVARVED